MLLNTLLLLAFVNSIIAEITLTVTASSSTSQTVQCITKLTTSSVKTPVPTTSSTKTLLPEVIVIISASTPLKTVTPAPTTTTTTTTAKKTVTSTASGITNTFSTTSTYTVTSTFTTTNVFFTTSTSTASETVVATSTIPAPAGFEGIEASSGDMNYMQKRDVIGGLLRGRAAPQPDSQSSSYPKSVTCTKYVFVVYTEKIIAVKPTSTVTGPAPTSTVTATVTSTSTSTVLPTSVSVTHTFSATATVTNTVTTSSTSTITASTTITTSTTTTIYAACGPTNILGPQIQTGDYLSTGLLNDNNAGQSYLDGIPSAYDCCVACLTGDNCQLSQFIQGPNECVLTGGDPALCNNPGYLAGYFTTRSAQDFFVYSNGPCGVVGDANNIVVWDG